MLYMSISGFFANAACGPKTHSDTAPRAFLSNALIWQPVNRLIANRRVCQRHFRFNPLRILPLWTMCRIVTIVYFGKRMAIKHIHCWTSVILAILTTFVFSTTLGAQHMPGTKWYQRETEGFLLIYPKSLSDDAAALSIVLDDILESTSAELPITHKKKKWPLVLTDLGLEANGYVSLMPRRSVWYATPGEDFTATSDWWMFLARHEGRHLAHFDATDSGFTRVLHILFGELGWGAGFVFGHPSWLLEGDSIYQETALSEEGRGRDPLFNQEMALIAAENPETGYYALSNPSYRTHNPTVYHMGYAFTSWIRRQYGDEAMKTIYNFASRIGLPVIAIDIGMLKGTGGHPRNVFKEMMQDLAVRTRELKNSGSWTEAEIIRPKGKVFTRIDPLFTDRQEDGEIVVFARKTTLAEPARLIRLNSDASEKALIRLPSRGRVSMSRLEQGAGYRLVWHAIRHHPMFEAVSASDFTVVDMDNNGRVIRRFHPVTGSRYLYPALSADGRFIAAADMGRGNDNRTIVLDAESGMVLQTLDLPEASASYPSWSDAGDRVVFTIRSNGGRRIAEWPIETNELRWLTPLSWETVKHPVYSADSREVVYSSNAGGIEAIRAVSVETLEVRVVAQRWYSASQPVISPDGKWVYFVEYASTKGEQLARVAYSHTVEENAILSAKSILKVEDSIPNMPNQTLRDPDNIREVVARGNTEHPESRYRFSTHAFNIHSWGLLFDEFNPNILTLNVRSRDILNTLAWETGALFDFNEISPGAYMQIALTAMRPNFYIRNTYKHRRINTDMARSQFDSLIGARYAVNLSRNGIWGHYLLFDASGSIRVLEDSPVLPIFTYSTRWSHLRGGSRRSFRPELGWILKGTYAHIPITAHFGEVTTAEINVYFPGGFRNTSLRLRGGIEHRTFDSTLLRR